MKNRKIKKILFLLICVSIQVIYASSPASTPSTPKKTPQRGAAAAAAASASPSTPSTRPVEFSEIASGDYSGKAFYNFARMDLSAAQSLNNRLNSLLANKITSIYDISNILFFSQQAAEKSIKASLKNILTEEDFSKIVKTHDLILLATILFEKDENQKFISQAKLLNLYQNSPRYPDMSLPVDLSPLSAKLDKAIAEGDDESLDDVRLDLKEVANDAVKAAEFVIYGVDKSLKTPAKEKGKILDPTRKYRPITISLSSSDEEETEASATPRPKSAASSPSSSPRSLSSSAAASPAASSSPSPRKSLTPKEYVSEKKQIEQWLTSARNDIESAKIFIPEIRRYEGVIFTLSEQAIEKLLKAFLIFLKVQYTPTHDIKKLITILAEIQVKPILINKEREEKKLIATKEPKSPPIKRVNISQRSLTEDEIKDNADPVIKDIYVHAEPLKAAYFETRYPKDPKDLMKTKALARAKAPSTLTPMKAFEIAQETLKYVEEQITRLLALQKP